MNASNSSLKNGLHIFTKILSWALFVILLIIAAFLLYYYVATKVYAAKGPGYEPNFSIYTIISGSMKETIQVYDTVVNVKVNNPKDIEVGDVITFISSGIMTSGMTTTHRVIAITEEDGEVCFQTQGDANPVPDQSCAKYSNIIGKVVLVIPQLGQIQFFLASKAGWLLCILIPALYIIIKDILKITKLSNIKNTTAKMAETKKKDPKKEQKEKNRKEELKRKLLKEDIDKDYYVEPEIKTIEKKRKTTKNKKKSKK